MVVVKGRAREGSKKVHWDSGKGKVKESGVTRSSTVSGPFYKTEFNSLPIVIHHLKICLQALLTKTLKEHLGGVQLVKDGLGAGYIPAG